MSALFLDLFQDWLNQAAQCPPGADQIRILEEAVQRADDEQAHELAFYGRLHLTEAYYSFGQFEKFLAAFYWCLEVHDLNPSVFPSYELLRQYQWLAEHIDKSFSLEQEQIEHIFDDMKRRYEAAGASLRPYYLFKSLSYRRMGKPFEADALFRKYQQTPPDDLSACRACDQHAAMQQLFTEQKTAEAIELGLQLCEQPPLCATVPSQTSADLLLPLFQEGRLAEAQLCQQRGYFLIRDNPRYLHALSSHLLFLTHTNLRQAERLFLRHIEFAETTYNMYDQFYFFLGSVCLLKRSDSPALHDTFSLEALEAFLYDLAAAFDKRNGNQLFADTLQQALASHT